MHGSDSGVKRALPPECDTRTSASFYTDALILFEDGDEHEAIRRLKERERANLPEVTRAMVGSFRALAEGIHDESLDATRRALAHFPDPEGRYDLTRHLAYWGENDEALSQFEAVLEGRFNIYRALTRSDSWLVSLRSHEGYEALVAKAKTRYDAAKAAFVEAHGDRLLGVTIP